MKRFINLFTILLVSFSLFLSDLTVNAQTYTGKVYTTAERQPEFPGGQAALGRYLAENIRVPNSLAKKKYNTGPIAAKFIVDATGYIHDIRVTTKPLDKKTQKGLEPFLANIIAAIEKMPRWEPGEVEGKRVAVFYTLPIEVNL
jgi:hypothetical protein